MKNSRTIGFGEGDVEAFEDWIESKPKSWVYAGEKGWIELSSAKFLDVSEDLYGRDKVSFEYYGQQFESMVISSHNKPNKPSQNE